MVRTLHLVRARRILWSWCVVLLVLSLSALAAPGQEARSRLVTTPAVAGGEQEVDAEVLAAAATAATAATAAASPSVAAGPTVVAPAPAPVPAPSGYSSTTSRNRATVPASATPLPPTVPPPPPTVPAVAADGSTPCTVKPSPGWLTLPNAHAVAGTFGSIPGFAIDNCRPVAGDVVGVQAFVSTPGAALRVSFGDGTSAGTADGDCSFPMGHVKEDHRYTSPGRYLIEATEFAPCVDWPEKHYRVWIEVSAGVVPHAAGAEPCQGTGPVKPGEPARYGMTSRDVPAPRYGTVRMMLNRCSVRAGGQSELVVFLYEPNLAIDWGDGTPPQAFHQKGHQGANVLHTFTKRGLHTVRAWIVVDGSPSGPVAFTVLVS